jgi:DNA-binding transcriptional LysR family regulator
LESSAALTLMALAEVGYGVAVLPSNIHAPRGTVRGLPLVDRGQSVGKRSVIAWNPQRTLAPYAEQFVEEIVVHMQRTYPGRTLTRRAPAIPRLKEMAV